MLRLHLFLGDGRPELLGVEARGERVRQEQPRRVVQRSLLPEVHLSTDNERKIVMRDSRYPVCTLRAFYTI